MLDFIPGSFNQSLLSITQASPEEAGLHGRFRMCNGIWIIINILCGIAELRSLWLVLSALHYGQLSPADLLPLAAFVLFLKFLTLRENL